MTIVLMIVTLSPTVPIAHAMGTQDTATSVTVVQPLVSLKSQDYAALDGYYSRIQREYEAGRLSDQQLYAEFRKLYEDSIDNERYFDDWVQSFPKSYPARLARGAYLYRMAWAARGERYIQETPRSQVSAMENFLARARPDLLDSLKLTPKPYLSALYLLNVAALDGSRSECRHWLNRGTAIDPAGIMVRYRYMWSLRPRWGGSYDEMHDYLRRSQAEHLNPQLLARMAILIHTDLAKDAQTEKDRAHAFSEWGQVLTLARTAREEPSTEALVGYSTAAWELHRRADADKALEELARRDVNEGWALAKIGWLYVQEHRDREGWPFLQRAASAGSPWAEFAVGKTLYEGCPDLNLPADHSAGIEWIKRSADHCFNEAGEFLASHQLPAPPYCDRQ